MDYLFVVKNPQMLLDAEEHAQKYRQYPKKKLLNIPTIQEKKSMSKVSSPNYN